MTSVKSWINKQDGIQPLKMRTIFLDKERNILFLMIWLQQIQLN